MTDAEGFRYELPEDTPDRWSGLSDAAREKIVGQAAGPSTADELLGTEQSGAADSHASPIALKTIADGVENALDMLDPYRGLMPTLPESAAELTRGHKRYVEVASHLFASHVALRLSHATQRDGETNVSKNMKVTLVPWLEWWNQRERTGDYLASLRREQNKDRTPTVISDDVVPRDIYEAIRYNKEIYRYPNNPATLLTPREYLEHKIDKDGPWGIMLAQASDYPGVDGTQETLHASPNELTEEGKAHYAINGINVDALGFYEWWSFTLQHGLNRYDGWSWLLANRLPQPSNVEEGREEPIVFESHTSSGGKEECLEIVRDWPTSQDVDTQPRLAVL